MTVNLTPSYPDVRIIKQTPHAQCCVGYEADVNILNKVCHRCGCAICDNHQPTPIFGEWPMGNPEYKYLMLLGDKNQAVIHCAACAKEPRSWWRKLVRIIGWLLLNNDWIQKHWYLGRHRPPLPMTPDLNGVQISEKMKGRITLDTAGRYEGQVDKWPTGEIKFTFQFLGRDRLVRDLYNQKYGVKLRDDLPFHAGFAILNNTVSLCFDTLSPDSTFAKVGVLDLTGQVGDVPFLAQTTSRSGCLPRWWANLFSRPAQTDPAVSTPLSEGVEPPKLPKSTWEPSLPYTLLHRDKDKPPGLPVRLVPAIAPDDQGRTLEITVQLNQNIGTTPEFDRVSIDDFTVQAPERVQPVQQNIPFKRMSSTGIQATPPPPQVEITWQGVYDLTKTSPQLSVFVRYTEKLDPTMQVKGKLKLTFAGSLSGIKGDVHHFYPWGAKHKKMTARRSATVEIDFDLSLNKLRFQDMERRRTLLPQTARREYPGIALEHPIINTLTQALNANGLYIHKVVENPAHVSKLNAHVVNRLWDIDGRRYAGAYPIDFHLMLRGEEFVGPQRNRNGHLGFAAQGENAGTTDYHRDNKVVVDITVQGVADGEDMRDAVESLFMQLTKLIDQTLSVTPPVPTPDESPRAEDEGS